MSSFERVGQILPRTVKRAKIADELLALQVRESFVESLNTVFSGKRLPKITAGKFSFGALTILVPDPAWSYHLRQKEGQVLKKINSSLGKEVVQKLRFRVVAK